MKSRDNEALARHGTYGNGVIRNKNELKFFKAHIMHHLQTNVSFLCTGLKIFFCQIHFSAFYLVGGINPTYQPRLRAFLLMCSCNLHIPPVW